MTFHSLTVFQQSSGKAVEYYITNTLKKPNQVPVRQFFKQVEQLNSYLKNLPFLYYSPKVNSASKLVLLLDDSDLVTHLLYGVLRSGRDSMTSTTTPPLSAQELCWLSRTSRLMKWSMHSPLAISRPNRLFQKGRWS